MIEHPDITHMNVTGYPQQKPYHALLCAKCREEITGFELVRYEEECFCNWNCMGEWMLQRGYADIEGVEINY